MSVAPKHVPNPGHGDHGASPSEYAKFAEKLSGEDETPAAPSVALLQLITLIRKADDGKEDAWTPLVENELKHMRSAVKLLTSNPAIQLRFGNSLEGAMKLVGILKARASERSLESQIDSVVDEELIPNLPIASVAASSAFVSRQDERAERMRSRARA